MTCRKLSAIIFFAVIILAGFGFAQNASAAYYSTGNWTSTNLLSGETVTSIDSFIYNLSAKPANTGATIQFSQNNTNWYDAAGTLNASNTLTTGVNNTINLSGLGWSGANFYYKITFTSSDGVGTPVLDDISVIFTSNQPPNTPTSLGPAGLVDGSFTADNTPTPTSTLSDPDAADTVKFQIQIDDTANFSSPVVDYTSALAAQGATSFTVGQAAGSGTYATGTAGQTLADESYYWRVKAIDNSAAESAYSTANAGAIAFKVDATAPTTPGTPSTTDPSSDNTPTWSWTESTDGGSGLHATTPYRVEWSTDSGFSSTTGTSTAAAASFTHIDTLADGTWYLRVKAKDALDSESSFSSNGSIAIDTSVPSVPSSGGGTSGSAAAGTRWLQQQGFLPSPPEPPPPAKEPAPPVPVTPLPIPVTPPPVPVTPPLERESKTDKPSINISSNGVVLNPTKTLKLTAGTSLNIAVRPEKPATAVKIIIIFKKPSQASYLNNNEASLGGFSLIPLASAQTSKQDQLIAKYDWQIAEYFLIDTDDDGVFEDEIDLPATTGEYVVRITLFYEDGTVENIETKILIDPKGYIYQDIDGKELRIPNAKVSIYAFNPEINKYELWPAQDFNQENPQITDKTGEYAFLVPEGAYYLTVEALNYQSFKSKKIEVREGDNINKNISLTPVSKFDWQWLLVFFIFITGLIIVAIIRQRKAHSGVSTN